MADTKVTKTEAVRRAMGELGKDASRPDIQKYVKDKFGYDMSPDHISNCKSDLRKRGKKQTTKKKPQAAATAAVATNGKGAKAIPLADILAVKALVERLGAAPLRTLIDAFSK